MTKKIGSILLALAVLIPLHGSALTCLTAVHFVVRCQDDICTEGFFAPRKWAGTWCDTRLHVQPDEPVQKFDGQFGPLKINASERLNGYYRIETYGRYYFDDESLEKLGCFKRNEAGEFSLTCHNPYSKLVKLDFPPEQTISSVILEMAKQSKREELMNTLMHYLLPCVALIFMIWAGLKFRNPLGNKLAVVVLVISFIGSSEYLWGRILWFLTGLVGFLYCAIWIVLKFVLRNRTKSKSTTS